VAARGGFVTVSGQLGRILVQLVAIAVLARLLTPRDYGLVALVMAMVGIGEIFRDFGLSTAAVQAKTLSVLQRDSLFWANAGIGVGLSLLAVAGAGLVAWAFREPLLGPIMQAIGTTFLLNGLATQYRAGLQRDFRFGTLAVADVSSQVVGFLAGLLLALQGAGYWALVGQQVVQAAAALGFVVVAAGWLPGSPRRGADLRPFLRFGRDFVAGQLVAYAAKNVDSVIIGARFGVEPLGVYSRAYQVLMGPLARLRAPTTTVALPVLSRLQDDERRFGDYLRRGQVALGYTFIAALGIAAGASDPIVRIMLGERWLDVVPLFTVLAFAAVFETLPYVGFWVYLSRGLTAALFRYTAAISVLKIALILAGSTWGTLGVAVGYAVGSGLHWPLALWRLSRITSLPLGGLVAGGARILLLALTAGGAAYAAAAAGSGAPAIVRLVLAVLAGLAVYGAAGLVVPAVRRDEAVLADMARRVLQRRATTAA
jgi:PST family polysaccharide transporter